MLAQGIEDSIRLKLALSGTLTPARHAITQQVKSLLPGLSLEKQDDIRTAVGEGLNNAVRHGLEFEIEIVLSVGQDLLSIDLVAQSHEDFHVVINAAIECARSHEGDYSSMVICGRGIALMYMLTEELSVEGRRLHLGFKID